MLPGSITVRRVIIAKEKIESGIKSRIPRCKRVRRRIAIRRHDAVFHGERSKNGALPSTNNVPHASVVCRARGRVSRAQMPPEVANISSKRIRYNNEPSFQEEANLLIVLKK
jgi:hypothetical protein